MIRWKIYNNIDINLSPEILKVLEEVADVDTANPNRNLLLKNIKHYDAYLASASVMADREVLTKANNLKVIATPSTGTDHIDVDFAKERQIDILDITKEYTLLNSFTATAEMAWCLLLACIRRLPEAIDAVKKGDWARQRFSGRQLANKTLGILGYGRLGKMVAEMGKAFRMKVIVCDLKKIETQDVRQINLDTLLKESDVVSIHIHLTKENTKLISYSEFKKMKQGVIIINTSRGAIIDEEAFLDALKIKKVGAAGIDVICGEWNKNLSSHPLIQYARTHNNLIITPHIAGSTVESIVGAKAFIVQKLTDYIKERQK